MRVVEDKRALVASFKACLMEAGGVDIDNRNKYFPLEPLDEISFIWSLDSPWYVEGELYDENGTYLQRKVIANLSPGEFFVLPRSLPSGLHLHARLDGQGSCHIAKISNVLRAVNNHSVLKVISNKICHAFRILANFEHDILKATLSRPFVFEPNSDFKLPQARMGLSGEKSFWIKGDGLRLFPEPRGRKSKLPNYWFVHPDAGFLNDQEDPRAIQSFTNDAFFQQPQVLVNLSEQADFQWNELFLRWKGHFEKNQKFQQDHDSRDDIYSQSIKGRLLNLLSGAKSYLPETSNHTLRSAFYLINRCGWAPNIPKNTDSENAFELLGRICDSSGLIMRESRLKGKWWTQDTGSFIAFDREEKAHVLFFRRGSYYFWNSEADKVSRLKSKHREQLSTQVVYFYKQLPAQPLTLFDLVFFEVQSVRFEIVMVIFLATISSGLVATLPVLSAYVVNVLLPSALTGLLALVCGGLIVVGVFQTVFTWFDTMIMTRINYRLSLASNAALWHRILHFPSKVLSQHASGDIAMRMTSCLGMQEFFRTISQRLVTMIFQLGSSLGVILWVSFELGMGVLAFGLLSFLAAIGFTYWQIRAFMAGEKSLGIVNSYILEIYSGIHKIKAAGVETECLQQWAERYGRLRRKLVASQKVRILHNTFQTSWVTLTTALVYWMIVELSDVELEPAMFIAFLGAFAVFSGNLGALCNIIVMSGIQIPMFKFIKPLLDNSPELKADLMTPDKIQGNLKIDRISYYYPGQNSAALQQISLFIRQGSFVVVAGGSGSGKSTLGKLISGLDHPSHGHVFIDDYELHTLDPVVLKSNIAVVPQDFRLIQGTLFENIKGATDATLEDVIAASKAACIWEEIDQLPMKLHTLTGTQFGAFSGGQIQRIAIARALVRKPRILVMDEATSALDNHLQEQIIQNVRSMNCTVIFIAHRLKIAQRADQIFVLDNGECVEKGTFNELLKNGRHFAKMWAALS